MKIHFVDDFIQILQTIGNGGFSYPGSSLNEVSQEDIIIPSQKSASERREQRTHISSKRQRQKTR
jgi:hypothetical protein